MNDSSADNSPDYSEDPTSLFAGWEGWAAAINIFCCLVGVVFETIFIVGAYSLCGYESNYSFTLLVCTALMGLQVHILVSIASLLSVLCPDFVEIDLVSRLFGCPIYVCFLSILICNVVLTCHRILYTIRPLKASTYCPSWFAKALVFAILTFHTVFIFFLIVNPAFTSKFEADWLSYASWDIEDNRNVLRTINTFINYSTLIFNGTAYPLIFLILYCKGSLTCRNNKEVKMTVQVAISVLCEIGYFIYWKSPSEETGVNFILANLSDTSYCFVILLPYIIFNRAIHRNLRMLLRKRRTPQHSIATSISQRRSTTVTTL